MKLMLGLYDMAGNVAEWVAMYIDPLLMVNSTFQLLEEMITKDCIDGERNEAILAEQTEYKHFLTEKKLRL